MYLVIANELVELGIDQEQMLIPPKKERSRHCLPHDENTPPPMKQSCKIKKHALNVMISRSRPKHQIYRKYRGTR